MRFNELSFLVFIAIFFMAYFWVRGRRRLIFILGASYFFYGWWDWRFLGMLWFTTLVNYAIGILIEEGSDKARRRLVISSVIINLGVLGYFKYCNFFISSIRALLNIMGVESGLDLLDVVLPIGISFYTFMSMGYTIDVYRRLMPAERSLLNFSVFVSFFPHLVAGPILRPDHFLPQLRKEPVIESEKILVGLCWIVLGFVKKVVIADSLVVYVDRVFANPDANGGLGLLIGMVFYAFQIYCDFSGYSDIAYGIAKIMGYDLGRNFRRPYLACNFSDFWRRWHISLSQWLRDYLYIPLGGNRGGVLGHCRNLMVTMLLGGLWHGANWTFIIWGGIHGLYLVIQRLLPPSAFNCENAGWLRRGVQIVFVFFAVCVSWVFFRSKDMATALGYLGGLFTSSWSTDLILYKFVVAKGVVLILCLLAFEVFSESRPLGSLVVRRPIFVSLVISAGLCLIAFWGSFGGGHFIYFQF